MSTSLIASATLFHRLQAWLGRSAQRQPLRTPLHRAATADTVQLPKAAGTPESSLQPATHHRPHRALPKRRTPALRVLRVLDAHPGVRHSGRMVISGRMADVCAELDRLAAMEARLQPGA